MPPILRERLIWQRMTRNTNTVKITAWGAVCIWNATSIAVGRFQKERIYDLEKFIERYTHTAGDEAILMDMVVEELLVITEELLYMVLMF